MRCSGLMETPSAIEARGARSRSSASTPASPDQAGRIGACRDGRAASTNKMPRQGLGNRRGLGSTAVSGRLCCRSRLAATTRLSSLVEMSPFGVIGHQVAVHRDLLHRALRARLDQHIIEAPLLPRRGPLFREWDGKAQRCGRHGVAPRFTTLPRRKQDSQRLYFHDVTGGRLGIVRTEFPIAPTPANCRGGALATSARA